jgi:ribA/ribD-fused uncharacterized protein
MSEPVDFYGGPLSNFAYSTIQIDVGFGPQVYTTVEHAFQAAKCTNLSDHYNVKGAQSPGLAKQAGRNVQLRKDWEQIKYDVMLKCLRAKFEIPFYKEILLTTGSREIREDSPTDFEWGYRNGGKNLLGKALMQIRSEIRGE